MKKHDEGYVLAMVMAVIAVLAVVASAMLGVGLRNVQTQQTAVIRMQDKYKAEGMIESIVAEMAVLQQEKTVNAYNEAGKALETAINHYLDRYNTDNTTEVNKDGIITTYKWDGTEPNCEIMIKAETEKIIVKAELALKYKVEPSLPSPLYVATVDSIEYISYEITTANE